MTLLTRIALAGVLIGTACFSSSAQTEPATATPPAAQSKAPEETAPATTTTPSGSPITTPQQTAPSPATPPAAQSGGTKPPSATAQRPMTSEEVLKQEEKQRALGVVPMFGMTSVRNAPPLSSKQKFQLMARTMIDPFTFVSAGLTAGLGQATDSFKGYGQGASGFGKRYGAALLDNADSNFFSNYFYPVLFKQDPRYFRMGEGTKKSRMESALEQEFVARKDSGGHTFHFSNVLGAFTAGGISNAYYPESDRGFGLTMGRAGTALGYGCIGDIFLEFWPDIQSRLFNRRQNQAHPSEPPGAPPK